jgi:hypothetical protein
VWGYGTAVALLLGVHVDHMIGQFACEEKFMKNDEYQTYLLGRKLGWAKSKGTRPFCLTDGS